MKSDGSLDFGWFLLSLGIRGRIPGLAMMKAKKQRDLVACSVAPVKSVGSV